MSKKKITIELPEEVAQAYEEASPSDRQRVERAVAYSLMKQGVDIATTSDSLPLRSILTVSKPSIAGK